MAVAGLCVTYMTTQVSAAKICKLGTVWPFAILHGILG